MPAVASHRARSAVYAAALANVFHQRWSRESGVQSAPGDGRGERGQGVCDDD
jgi:hypothetical protein